MNQLYAKFVSYEESIPNCCLIGKDQIVKCSNFEGFIRFWSRKNAPMTEGCAAKLPFYHSLLFKEKKMLKDKEEKLENKPRYSNYHIIHGLHLYGCVSPLIFSLYDADLKNYLFLKKEHALVQWRRERKGVHSRLADNPGNRKKTKCQIVLKLCTPPESLESEHSGPNPWLSAVLCWLFYFIEKASWNQKLRVFPPAESFFICILWWLLA